MHVEILIVSPRVLVIGPFPKTVVIKAVANELFVFIALVILIPGALINETLFGAKIQSLPILYAKTNTPRPHPVNRT